MIKVDLVGFVEDQKTREEVDGGKGWIEWRVLGLVDDKMANPEWFCVAACNEYYFDKKIRHLEDTKMASYLIEDTFSESQLFEFTSKKFSRLVFNNWDDFYEKMSREFFIYD